jgi:hypothetical protein
VSPPDPAMSHFSSLSDDKCDTGAASDLAASFYERLCVRFDLAAEAVGEAFIADLEMAGLRVRLVFAGASMREALLPPFEHLITEWVEPPQITIRVFDTASTGVEPPPPSWQPLEAAPGTNPVARLRSERACVLAGAGTGAVTAVDSTAGEAVFHLPDAARVAPSERAAPLRDALQLLMASRQRCMTHAGAVGRDGRGVLLAGRGGSGKSTLALACALSGMEIVADDYILLDAGRPPVAHAMQSTAKLTADSVARLGIAYGSIDPAGFEPTLEGPPKALVEIGSIAPDKLRWQLEIVALVAPTIPQVSSHLVKDGLTKCELDPRGEWGPSVQEISPAEGLRAIAPSTIVQSSVGGGESLAVLAALVRNVPSYALRLAPDPAANAAAVDRLVAELG